MEVHEDDMEVQEEAVDIMNYEVASGSIPYKVLMGLSGVEHHFLDRA